MNECEFCRSLQIHHNVFTIGKGRDTRQSYSVALVTYTWVKGRKRMAARSIDYKRKGKGYELNYCPECGRLIARKETTEE